MFAISEDSARFDGSIPGMYDRYLGAVLFEPHAADIVGRVANPIQVPLRAHVVTAIKS